MTETAIVGNSGEGWIYILLPAETGARSAKASGGGIYHAKTPSGRDGVLITVSDEGTWHIDGHDGPIVWIGDYWRTCLPASGLAYPYEPGVPVSHAERDGYERAVIATAMRQAAAGSGQ